MGEESLKIVREKFEIGNIVERLVELYNKEGVYKMGGPLNPPSPPMAGSQGGLVVESLSKLQAYCEANQFKGWDPFDGLNSRLFQAIPIVRNNRLARMAMVQFMKHCPVNLRPLLLIEKGYNAKGLGLFLSGYCQQYASSPRPEIMSKIRELTQKILSLQIQGYSGACWGYNFDWQARAFLLPKNSPSVVATTYVASALLDAYDLTKEEKLRDIARSACDFVLKDLQRTEIEGQGFVFSYSPLDHSQVFNASLLGARLLSRVYSYTKEDILISTAKETIKACCHFQKTNGSWPYGTLHFHQWVDSFHTGFNLECIQAYQEYSGDKSFESNLEKGLEFYLNTFFTEDGKSKYYEDTIYPIDVHAPAQLIITLAKLNLLEKHQELASRVLSWTIEHMQDPRGYFYYQVSKRSRNKIAYMRWTHAWMFYALSLREKK